MSGALHALAWAKSVRCGREGQAITPSQKLTLLTLADYNNASTGYAWPSCATLAADCLVSRRQVQTNLRALEEAGLITVQARYTAHGQTSNAYRLCIGAIPAPAPEPAQPIEEPTGLSATQIRDAFLEILPDIVADSSTPSAGFIEALSAADAVAADHPEISNDLQGFLRNSVLGAAAMITHDLPPAKCGRLFKEAKTLGADGHRWLVVALHTAASADITGDPSSYVIRVARNLRKEQAGVA
jgi:hypothetical protein